jgi:hypothetical protein
MSSKTIDSRKLAGLAIVIVIGIVIIAALPFLIGALSVLKSVQWILIAGLMVVFLTIIGKSVNGRWTGILIDERKVMTLSRFQILIWTVIILSAYLTMVSARIYAGVDDPLAIEIDWTLWALLGISSTSLVGTPLIVDSKKKKIIDEDKEAKKLRDIAARDKEIRVVATSVESDRIDRQSKAIQVIPDNVKSAIAQSQLQSIEIQDKAIRDKVIQDNTKGIVFVNKNDNDASFSDIFEGDEVGNEGHVDVSKVQMFFFTIISVLSYLVMLFVMLADPSVPTRFPVLSEGLIAILTISHGAYLTNKTVDHTSTKPE